MFKTLSGVINLLCEFQRNCIIIILNLLFSIFRNIKIMQILLVQPIFIVLWASDLISHNTAYIVCVKIPQTMHYNIKTLVTVKKLTCKLYWYFCSNFAKYFFNSKLYQILYQMCLLLVIFLYVW
jgi:hypothetical protein